MKITKKQLKQIIREERIKILGERAISPEQAEDYLRSKADEYRRQGLEGKSMEMLLMDDFMDDLGHQHDVADYEGYIRELVLGESKMRVTKKQLKQIVKEEKERLIREMNPDGTVSDDEEEREEDLMKSIEMRIDELIDMVVEEAYVIGGTFRSPGIRKRAKELMMLKINRMRG